MEDKINDVFEELIKKGWGEGVDVIEEYITNLQQENKQLKEEIEEYRYILKMQNEREYHSKFLKDFQKEKGKNVLPDFDEIYKRYDNLKSILTELEEWLKAVYEDYDDWKDEYRYLTYITAINETFDKIQELKEKYK